MAFDLRRRAVAELLGTGTLVAAVVGSGIMAERLADGNVALALLCNTIPTGAILVVLILILGPVSGAHLNPAVSTAFFVRRDLPAREAGVYILAQIAGGVLGAIAAHVMFDLPLLQLSATTRAGFGQWAGEILATFGLLATILGCVRFKPDAVPYAVGLFITSAYWFTSSTSFANPAVTIARALSDTFAGIRPLDAPAFITMQLLGAVAATLIFGWLFRAEFSSISRKSAPEAAE
jgi:glycerol uptake facilitator-like aquaporin